MQKEDAVNHPSHYLKCAITLEPIEITSRLSSCYGQALNYILRAPYKGHRKEDYAKAIFYLKKAIEIKDFPRISLADSPETFMYFYMFWKHSQDDFLIFKALFYYADLEQYFYTNKQSIEKVIASLENECTTDII